MVVVVGAMVAEEEGMDLWCYGIRLRVADGVVYNELRRDVGYRSIQAEDDSWLLSGEHACQGGLTASTKFRK